MVSRQKLGAWGENQAVEFLKRQGFTVVDRNYHTTMGEIDIVARRGTDIYFIEVKTRSSAVLANDTAVTPLKRHKFDKAVRHYCYHHNIPGEVIVEGGLVVAVNRDARRVNFRLVLW